MALVKTLANFVMREVAGMSDAAIVQQAVVRSCREFCEGTRIWTQELSPIDVVADRSSYSLVLSDGDVTCVVRASYNGSPMTETSQQDMDALYPSSQWRTTTEVTPRRFYLNPDKNSLRLVYTPSEALTDGLDVVVAKKPEWGVEDVEDFFETQYLDAVVAGAKWALFSQVSQTWGNAELAAYQRRIFITEIGKARAGLVSINGQSSSVRGRSL